MPEQVESTADREDRGAERHRPVACGNRRQPGHAACPVAPGGEKQRRRERRKAAVEHRVIRCEEAFLAEVEVIVRPSVEQEAAEEPERRDENGHIERKGSAFETGAFARKSGSCHPMRVLYGRPYDPPAPACAP